MAYPSNEHRLIIDHGSGVRLSLAVTHDTRRRAFLPKLLAKLNAPPQVCYDHRHEGVWPVTRSAWLTTPPCATHRLILQDDVMVCTDFVATVLRILAARPACFLSFYGFGPHMPTTHDTHGHRYIRYRAPSGCAPCLPAAWIRDFVAWADAADLGTVPHVYNQRGQPMDDVLLYTWLRLTSRPAYHVTPSLVRHVGWGHSLHQDDIIRFNDGGPEYIGDESSGLTYDWRVWGEFERIDRHMDDPVMEHPAIPVVPPPLSPPRFLKGA